MKKLFTLLFVITAMTSFAQFDIGIAASSVETASGTLVDVEVYVTDDEFDNMNHIQGSIHWDPLVAEYSAISYFGLFNPEMSMGDFDISDIDQGELTFSWFSTFTVGPNLNNGDVIFTIQFLAVGATGTSTDIEFTDDPLELSWFNGFAGSGGFNPESGFINVGGLNLTGCYNPQFWLTDTENTNGSVSNNAGTITMIGDNDLTGNGTTGVDCEGTEGNVSYCVMIPNDGTVTFDWDYAGLIDNADTDAFGYCLNGVSTQLASLAPPPFGTPFGSASFEVLAGDEFCFTMSSENANLPNAPVVTITEFTGPPCELPSLTASIMATQEILCMGDTDGALEVMTEYGTAPYSYTWDQDGVNGSNPSGLSAGTYCVTVIDAVPDTSYVCYELTESDTELTAVANSDDDDGFGTGSIFLNVTGGTPPYSIVWDTDPVMTGPIITGLDYGVYTYTATDDRGCVITGEVDVLYVGIDEISGLEQFEFYPNPANSSINLNIEFDQSRDFNINIMNALGQNILNVVSTSGSQFNDVIDVSNLNAGFYYLNLEVDGYQMTKKIIIE